MQINRLDHVNIRSACIEETLRFYGEILDMRGAPVPGMTDMSRAAWIYDSRGEPVIHLGHVDLQYPGEDDSARAARRKGSGMIDHVAFECSGYEAFLDRLSAANLTFHLNDVPQVGLRQIFIEDPNGVRLELNFR